MVYDYAIAGAGAAGMQLAMALLDSGYCDGKRLLILEPDSKTANDRTWSFWEKGSGKWDALTWKQWSSASFLQDDCTLNFPVHPYRYKSIRASTFNAFVLQQLHAHPAVTYLQEAVTQVVEGTPVSLHTAAGNTYKAAMVFDSRLPERYALEKQQYPFVLQHFKGWVVETAEPVFDPDRFVMMDFRYKLPGTTSFIYVLPEHASRALVEFTFFSPELVPQETYEAVIRQYLSDHLNGSQYTVAEEEYGIIPMSSFPFHRFHTPHVLHIGTAGGWVKPASGYSFRNAMINAERIVSNIRSGRPPGHGLHAARHRWYDSLLVDILQHRNELGPDIFKQMYRRNTPAAIFSFLDEETNLLQDAAIIASFHPGPFLSAMLRQWRRRV